MTPAYYKEYYELERSNWWFRARLEILKSQIQNHFYNKNDLKILNIGVATGATSVMLAQFGTVKSIEFDEICYQFVKEKLAIDIEQGSILDLQYEENTFDLVCAFDVVEHVENDQLAIIEMIRVCKSNGIVFVTVPAFMDLWSKHDEINYHFKRYTNKTLLPLFDANKGKFTYHSYFNTILFIPIYAVRWISNQFPNLFKRNGSDSDHSMFELGFLNKVFYGLFYAENILLKPKVKFPFGVSLMAIFRKK
jgi:SAM-dependent methyltransferase